MGIEKDDNRWGNITSPGTLGVDLSGGLLFLGVAAAGFLASRLVKTYRVQEGTVVLRRHWGGKIEDQAVHPGSIIKFYPVWEGISRVDTTTRSIGMQDEQREGEFVAGKPVKATLKGGGTLIVDVAHNVVIRGAADFVRARGFKPRVSFEDDPEAVQTIVSATKQAVHEMARNFTIDDMTKSEIRVLQRDGNVVKAAPLALMAHFVRDAVQQSLDDSLVHRVSANRGSSESLSKSLEGGKERRDLPIGVVVSNTFLSPDFGQDVREAVDQGRATRIITDAVKAQVKAVGPDVAKTIIMTEAAKNAAQEGGQTAVILDAGGRGNIDPMAAATWGRGTGRKRTTAAERLGVSRSRLGT